MILWTSRSILRRRLVYRIEADKGTYCGLDNLFLQSWQWVVSVGYLILEKYHITGLRQKQKKELNMDMARGFSYFSKLVGVSTSYTLVAVYYFVIQMHLLWCHQQSLWPLLVHLVVVVR